MTDLAWVLLACTLVIACIDWVAVGTGNRRLEYLAKPATMMALFGVVVTLDEVPAAVRLWFAAAVAMSLAGDVFLMLPRDLFVFGLGSFLLGHVAYVVGMAREGVEPGGVAAGLLVTALALATLGQRILRAVRATSPELAAPVVAYMLVISAMVAAAFGLLEPLAMVGAVLFYASDATIAWTRFIGPLRHERLLIMVSYHLGQVLLVLSLLT